MDNIDKKILKELRANARIPVTVLAQNVGRSRAAVQARLIKLETSGAIRGYTIREALENPTGNQIGAIVSVSVAVRSNANHLAGAFQKIPEVSSCLSVTGENAFVLLVARCNPERLKEVVELIYESKGVTKTDTLISLHTDF
ncbi:hypothetical protein MNBD_ALPHA03-1303 [hydrothermal vent metagenome]|uniref:HTH asnC-type domain-containing protein n=1 Tax=hydrothermal vent metagenome TaxID=652676 RepID=A0A3B1AXS7_9ZZZZ